MVFSVVYNGGKGGGVSSGEGGIWPARLDGWYSGLFECSRGVSGRERQGSLPSQIPPSKQPRIPTI